MKSALVRASSAILVLIGCLAAAATLVFVSPAARAQMGMTCSASSPCATPTPSQIPVNAYLTLDLSVGGANQQISVSGNQFLANEPMTLYWDVPNKVIGSAIAGPDGNFSGVKVKPFAGDPPGLHKICASVPPVPCAQFELQGTPTPTPSAPSSPSPSPSASAGATESPTPTATPLAIPAGSDTNNLDVLFQPPFIFLPFIAALGLVGAIAYWVFGTVARRPRVLPAASIVHRSVRPETGVPGIEFVPPAAPTPELPPLDVEPPWPSPNPTIEDPPDSDLPRD
jgi:hypothetical protein